MKTVSLLLPILLLIASCADNSSPVIRTERSSDPCINLLPSPAITEAGLDVETANIALQKFGLGNVNIKYQENVKRILDNTTTHEWVYRYFDCQATKHFESEERKAWLMSLQHISRNDPKNLLTWLENNKFPQRVNSTQNKNVQTRAMQNSKTMNIDRLFNRKLIPPTVTKAAINYIGVGGKLIVPGKTHVKIKNCFGEIYASLNALIEINYQGTGCKETIMSEGDLYKIMK